MSYEPVDLYPTMPNSGQSTYAAVQVSIREIAEPLVRRLLLDIWNPLVAPTLTFREELADAMGMKIAQAPRDLPRYLVSLRDALQRNLPPNNIEWISEHFTKRSLEINLWERLFPETASGDWLDDAGVLMLEALREHEEA